MDSIHSIAEGEIQFFMVDHICYHGLDFFFMVFGLVFLVFVFFVIWFGLLSVKVLLVRFYGNQSDFLFQIN
jgi:hypothetical protein